MCGHSQQPLQGSLLIDLVGAIRHIRIKVGFGVLANDVADAVDRDVVLVFLLQLFKEPKKKGHGQVAISPFYTACKGSPNPSCEAKRAG